MSGLDLREEIGRCIGVEFRNADLAQRAVTHRSAVPSDPRASYERMEFLGDAVLGFAICEMLYRCCPDLSEGEMAKRKAYLASEPVLAEACNAAGLVPLIILGSALDATGERNRSSIQADVVEALVGAVYLDRGLRSAKALVRRLLKPMIKRVMREGPDADCKTRLQELTQARWGLLPTYEIPPPVGEDHRPTFTSVVHVAGRLLGEGQGASKKAAQQAAARAALSRLEGEQANGK